MPLSPRRALRAARRLRTLLREDVPQPYRIARLDYEGADLYIGVGTRAELHSRIRPVAKEPWTVRWLEASLRPGDVFWDVGANVGAYSLVAARAGGGRVRVVAVEPAYATYAALCDNVVLNGLADVISPLPLVLGDAPRVGVLSYSAVEAGAAIHTLDGAVERRLDVAFRQPVLVHSVDDLVERFGLPAPTLMKVDVDGAEAAVLAGAARTLAAGTVRSLLVEVERERTGDLLAVVDEARFDLRERVDERNGVPLAHVWYGVFERR